MIGRPATTVERAVNRQVTPGKSKVWPVADDGRIRQAAAIDPAQSGRPAIVDSIIAHEIDHKRNIAEVRRCYSGVLERAFGLRPGKRHPTVPAIVCKPVFVEHELHTVRPAARAVDVVQRTISRRIRNPTIECLVERVERQRPALCKGLIEADNEMIGHGRTQRRITDNGENFLRLRLLMVAASRRVQTQRITQAPDSAKARLDESLIQIIVIGETQAGRQLKLADRPAVIQIGGISIQGAPGSSLGQRCIHVFTVRVEIRTRVEPRV